MQTHILPLAAVLADEPKAPRPCSQGQGVPAVKGVRQEVGARLVGRGGAVGGQHDVRAGDAQLPVLRLQRDDAQRGGVGLRTPFSGCNLGLVSGLWSWPALALQPSGNTSCSACGAACSAFMLQNWLC